MTLSRAAAPVIRGMFGRLPPPGTVLGDAARNAFLRDLLDTMGDTRLLWLPKTTDTTTSTDASRNARTFTYDATIASRISALGSGVAVSFNGTSQYATVPDNNDFSLGDGGNDSPFSVVALANVTNTAAQRTILSKFDTVAAATKREWYAFVDSADRQNFETWDESAAAAVGRRFNTAVTMGAWALLSFTYNGTRDTSGFAVYESATRKDNNSSTGTTGTYTAMENLTGVVGLGVDTSSGTPANYFAGSMAMVALVARELSPDDLWVVTNLCNGFFGLTLS